MGEGQNGHGTYRRGACKVHSFPDLSLPSPHRSKHLETSASYSFQGFRLHLAAGARYFYLLDCLPQEGLALWEQLLNM